jgi:hypothetical protein
MGRQAADRVFDIAASAGSSSGLGEGFAMASTPFRRSGLRCYQGSARDFPVTDRPNRAGAFRGSSRGVTTEGMRSLTGLVQRTGSSARRLRGLCFGLRRHCALAQPLLSSLIRL